FNPKDAASYYNDRGNVNFERGHFQEAVADYTSSLLIQDDRIVQLSRANVYCELGNLAFAENDIRNALNYGGGPGQPLLELLEEWRRRHRRSDDSTYPFWVVAQYCDRSGRQVEAFQAYKLVVERESLGWRLHHAYRYMLRWLHDERRYQELLKCY